MSFNASTGGNGADVHASVKGGPEGAAGGAQRRGEAKLVFISYSSKDQQIADKAREVLERNGLRCWIASRDIPAGHDWSQTIVEGIDAASAFVLLLSAQANKSAQVRREVERAWKRQIPFFTVRIENVRTWQKLDYFIRTRQRMDALTRPLEPRFERLVRVINDDPVEPDPPEKKPPLMTLAVAAMVIVPVAIAAGLAGVCVTTSKPQPIPVVDRSARLPPPPPPPPSRPDCHVIAATGPKGVNWPWMRQTLMASPQLHVVNRTPATGEVSFKVYNFDAAKKYDVLVAQCDRETCSRLAATYTKLVPFARPPPDFGCGPSPTYAGNGRPFDRPSLPDPSDGRESCARLSICQLDVDPSSDGNAGLKCQQKPQNFKLSCAQQETCREVVDCLGGPR